MAKLKIEVKKEPLGTRQMRYGRRLRVAVRATRKRTKSRRRRA